MMDTTAIFTHLKEVGSGDNTLFLLSNNLYQTVSQVWSIIPGINLVYEPLNNYDPEYLALLSTLDITIKCSNSELLQNLDRRQNVAITTENSHRGFLKDAFSRGFSNFFGVGNAKSSNVSDTFKDKCRFTQEISKEEIFEMKDGKLDCDFSQNICVGIFDNVKELDDASEALQDLKKKLPSSTILSVQLGQELFHSTTLLATRVLDKNTTEDSRSYTVDVSMFEELINYLDTGHEFYVYSDSNTTTTSPCTILGSTGEEDDVVMSEVELGELQVGDWILLGDISLAYCRHLDVILIDKDYRVVRAPLKQSGHLTTSFETPLLAAFA